MNITDLYSARRVSPGSRGLPMAMPVPVPQGHRCPLFSGYCLEDGRRAGGPVSLSTFSLPVAPVELSAFQGFSEARKKKVLCG